MNITFIGGGNMATALIGGLLKGKFYAPEELSVVEISEEACAQDCKASWLFGRPLIWHRAWQGAGLLCWR
jgi:pyrroline-5-carboxylate reductase